MLGICLTFCTLQNSIKYLFIHSNMGGKVDDIIEGNECELKVEAKGARGEGIGKCGDLVVMVRDSKTRIGNIYKVKVTKVFRTFAYAEIANSKQQFIAGSPIDFS